MQTRLNVKGIEECGKLLDEISQNNGHIFLLFIGTQDPTTGKSWCPDCVQTKPIVEEAIKESSPECAFVICVDVGDRVTWKNPDNPFRLDSRYQLKSIPTLIHYGTTKRLECDELNNLDMVKLLFKGDDAKSNPSTSCTDK